MLVVPVVFISIVLRAAGLGDLKQLGRIGLKSISFFLVTTAVAISIAVTLAQLAMVVLTAVLASIDTTGVPGVGLIILTMVLNQ